MDIQKDWPKIKRHFSKSFATSLHVSIASLEGENSPTITPIGTFFLRDDQTAFYFEKFPSKLPRHAADYPNICVLAVNSSRWMWLKALWSGSFKEYPAIKLYGKLGSVKIANQDELSRLKIRMRKTHGLKGHHYLWEDLHLVREMYITRAEIINLHKMTQHL